ncbi:MAG: hypothetical protein GXO83_02470 [Chlorobi bacterium]|nr:hypothetical protein [Chlorobiota bacterium]
MPTQREFLTGYFIGQPLIIQKETEASFNYRFGIHWFLHFLFAYIFFFNFLLRIFWAFLGNKYSRWKFIDENVTTE